MLRQKAVLSPPLPRLLPQCQQLMWSALARRCHPIIVHRRRCCHFCLPNLLWPRGMSASAMTCARVQACYITMFRARCHNAVLRLLQALVMASTPAGPTGPPAAWLAKPAAAAAGSPALDAAATAVARATAAVQHTAGLQQWPGGGTTGLPPGGATRLSASPAADAAAMPTAALLQQPAAVSHGHPGALHGQPGAAGLTAYLAAASAAGWILGSSYVLGQARQLSRGSTVSNVTPCHRPRRMPVQHSAAESMRACT